MDKAILLSGGIDSIALAYWKRPQIAFTINYGQKPANAEMQASETVCRLLGIKYIPVNVDCSHLGSGDLSKTDALEIAPSSEWWPYRNQLLITLASMKAITLGVNELMVGSVLSDGFHKDGTENFYHLLHSLVNYQESNITISAPAISLTSQELVIISGISSEILFYAHSCHKSNIPCGHCRGCNKYIEVINNLDNAGWK